MSMPRLTTSLWVSALLRRLQSDGVFAHVLAKGDATAGAIILSTRSKNNDIRMLERTATLQGTPAWMATSAVAQSESEALKSLAKARHRDPDLWWIEVDLDDLTPYLDGPILDTHKI